MNINLSVQFKAAFLLVVFSLSTLVSFACAAGLNMGFNQDHHKIQGYPSVSEDFGVKHKHASNGHDDITESSNENKSAHHEMKSSHSTESTPDDCCRDEAAKFVKCDKRTSQPINYSFQALFFTLTIHSYLNPDALVSILIQPDNRYFTRNHHPPIADTRIAIQSFLI